MNTNGEVVSSPSSTQAAAGGTAEIQPVTPEEVMEIVRTLKQRIPQYGQMPLSNRKSLRAVANVHPQLKSAAIGAIAASRVVENGVGLTADELHVLDDVAQRWSDAIEEVRGLLSGMIHANLKRRHRVGLATLQSYNITRQLVRSDNNAELLSVYDEMQRASRLRWKRREATPTTPAPVPTVPDAVTP